MPPPLQGLNDNSNNVDMTIDNIDSTTSNVNSNVNSTVFIITDSKQRENKRSQQNIHEIISNKHTTTTMINNSNIM